MVATRLTMASLATSECWAVLVGEMWTAPALRSWSTAEGIPP